MPHPGSDLLPQPRAYAEAILQVADHESKRDPRVAFEWYKHGDKIGNLEATFKLGCHYANGEDPIDKPSMRLANKYFRKAVEKGHARATYFLGLSYFYGEAVKINLTKALDLLTISSNKGDLDARSYIGYMYAHGVGVKRNFSRGEEIWRECASLGHRTSKQRLKQVENDEKMWKKFTTTPEPRPGSLQYKLFGGKEKAEKKEKEARALRIMKKRELKRLRKEGKITYDSSDPDDWTPERIEEERRAANMSVERALLTEERSKLRQAKKKLKKDRNHVSASLTGELPPILLPSEMDGTWESGNKIFLKGRYDVEKDIYANMLETGLFHKNELSQELKDKLKATTRREKPKGGVFYR